MKTVPPEQIAIIKQAHIDWLHHPTTKQVLEVMSKHRKKFFDQMSNDSAKLEIPDSDFRMKAHAAKTIESIITRITDTEIFFKELTQ